MHFLIPRGNNANRFIVRVNANLIIPAVAFPDHVDRGQGHLEDDQQSLVGGHHRGPQAALHHLGQRACQRLRPGTNFIKLFKDVIYENSQYTRVFVPGRSFQLSQGKVRSLPYSGASERFFNRVSSSFTNKHYTRLAMIKRSSLLRTFVKYRCKKFYIIGSRDQFYKTFLRPQVTNFVISQSVCPWQSSPTYRLEHLKGSSIG
jgi:hypothetical protein